MSSPPRQRRHIEEPSAPTSVFTPRELPPLPPEPKPTAAEIRYRESHGKYPPSYTQKRKAYTDELARRKSIYAPLGLMGSGNVCFGAMCDDGLPKLNPETGMPVYTSKPRNMSPAEMRQIIATHNPLAPKPLKYRPPEKSTWESRSRGYNKQYPFSKRGGSLCPICGEDVS